MLLTYILLVTEFQCQSLPLVQIPTINTLDLVREPNYENCLDLIFAVPPCEKVIIVPDTNYITFAIRTSMLDMPSPGSFQNIGLLILAQQGSEHVKPCGSNWVKIKGAQLKINLHSPIAH